MKKILFLLLISHNLFSQIEITPEITQFGSPVSTPSISTNTNKSFTLSPYGTGLMYLGANDKVSISTGIFTFPPPRWIYATDGKLHIRSNSDSTNFGLINGPTLLLEESQENDFARLRFRQAKISSENGFSSFQRGKRYWDISGFANSSLPKNDTLKFSNSSGVNPLILLGNGNVELEGFSKLGKDAPKIKMKKLEGNLANTEGATTTFSHGVSNIIMVYAFTDIYGTKIPQNFTRIGGSEFDILFNQTNVWFTTISGNSSYILGRPLTIFIIYEE